MIIFQVPQKKKWLPALSLSGSLSAPCFSSHKLPIWSRQIRKKKNQWKVHVWANIDKTEETIAGLVKMIQLKWPVLYKRVINSQENGTLQYVNINTHENLLWAKIRSGGKTRDYSLRESAWSQGYIYWVDLVAKSEIIWFWPQ